jgi:hypothetical protein
VIAASPPQVIVALRQQIERLRELQRAGPEDRFVGAALAIAEIESLIRKLEKNDGPTHKP